MTKRVNFLAFLFFINNFTFSQTIISTGFEKAPNILISKCFGGTDKEFLHDFKESTNGDFFISFSSRSNDGDIAFPNQGFDDIWLFKVSSDGNIIWRLKFATSRNETPHIVVPLSDGGCYYIFDKNGNEYYFQRISNNGDVVYQKYTLDLISDEYTGFISNNGQLITIGSAYGYMKITKYDVNGNIIANIYPTNGFSDSSSYGKSAIEMSDGTIFVVGDYWGYSRSLPNPPNYHYSLYDNTNNDGFIAKVNSSGSIAWTKCIGGYGNDFVRDIVKTDDDNLLVLGMTKSINSGDVFGKHKYNSNYDDGNEDLWLIKMDQNGTILWQRYFGGRGNDAGSKIIKAINGGYYIIGFSDSSNGELQGLPARGLDNILYHLDSNGMIKWIKKIGPSRIQVNYNDNYVYRSFLIENPNGIYVCTFASSNNSDVSGHHDGGGDIFQKQDIWFVKLDNTETCDSSINFNGILEKNLLIQSNSTIISNGKVSTQWGNIKFKTNQSITLQNGFEVKDGATFETVLNAGCNN